MATKGALAHIDQDIILSRICSGELMPTIAAELGVTKQSLRERLLAHPAYKDAIQAQAESIVEQATAECMSADLPADMPVIARARLRLEAAHKWASARDPARWGQASRVMGGDGGPVQIEIVRYSSPVTIEAEVSTDLAKLAK